MAAGAHDLLAVPPDTIDGALAAAEDESVENGVALAIDECGVIAIERDDVGGGAFGETGNRDAERAPTARERRVKERTAGRAAFCAAHEIAGAVDEALRIFELAQLIGD